MRIRSRLGLSAALAFIVSLTLIVLLWNTGKRSDERYASLETLGAAELALIRMQSLTHEFRQWGLARSAAQWQIQNKALLESVANFTQYDQIDAAWIEKFVAEVETIRTLFSELQHADIRVTGLQAELLDLRMRHLLISQVRLSDALRTEIVGSKRQLNRYEQRLRLFFAVTLVGLIAVSAFTAYFAEVATVRPLIRLRETAEQLSLGDLSARTGITSYDEIGDVAKSFDRMATSLQNTLASREDLAREVAHRRHAEQLSERALEDLKRSNAELKSFAYVASHDLQEPLRVISGYLQLIERRYAAKLDADGKEFIDFAVDAAKRMQALIMALLSYSRVTSGEQALERVDLNDVLSDVMRDLDQAILDSEASVSIDLLPQIQGDPAQLRQVFQNIVGNALKFARENTKPQVVVEAQALESVSEFNKVPGWRIVVSDNGIGIDEAYYQRVFEVFQRLHNREEYAGTGIGLAICKKVVERHGGQISVESAPGKGSRFLIDLPEAPPKQNLAPKDAGSTAVPGPETIDKMPGDIT